jgi:transcriptional antiterminator RfaH
MSFWAVVQTETRREFIAAEHLKRAGYETYTPRMQIRCNGDDRIVPLFPSYIFAATDLTNWTPIRWTIAVVRILMDGQRPAELPERVMNDIRRREGPAGIIKPPARQWIRGKTRLTVLRGSFRGLDAIYQDSTPRERVQVLLSMLGRQVSVELPLRDVEALDITR